MTTSRCPPSQTTDETWTFSLCLFVYGGADALVCLWRSEDLQSQSVLLSYHAVRPRAHRRRNAGPHGPHGQGTLLTLNRAATTPRLGHPGLQDSAEETRLLARRQRRGARSQAPPPVHLFRSALRSLRGRGIRPDAATFPCEPPRGARVPTPLRSAPCRAVGPRPSLAVGGARLCGDWCGRPPESSARVWDPGLGGPAPLRS
ncbi:uncharacterized protein LOC127232545 [Phodopus roborovskii]|uniref:uncharacterized protein LOC127232545 n=1 Tax=Phodopus roborovskii TaxID=109678 RepID=UPI0021E3CF1A|nr:uncharacterized protein LOC127232545 [Phodopus roborovskii]